jgi:hypothetical protein
MVFFSCIGYGPFIGAQHCSLVSTSATNSFTVGLLARQRINFLADERKSTLVDSGFWEYFSHILDDFCYEQVTSVSCGIWISRKEVKV